MNLSDIIIKKRDGSKLSEAEIHYFIEGYTEGKLPDYQAAALLMAIYFRKMDQEETVAMTMAMKHSGDVVDLSSIDGIKVDKHSTGGVGDKTTLIVGPMAAACGVPVAKMSGRGLGFTGGTVDKLESIPGFQTTLEADRFMKLVNEVGLSVIGQTGHIAPADKKIYALRDVTGTVDNLSLITSSVMSKKLASGSDGIVLDIKCGSGAFMETLEDASQMGELMVEIGKADHKKTIAVITDMNQPLGHAVGNSLEVIEAIETLKGNGPADIVELSEVLAGLMVYTGGKADSPEQGRAKAKQALESGMALEKLAEMIAGQGGDAGAIHDYTLFPAHNLALDLVSPADGFIAGINAATIGLASQRTGAGRMTKEEDIDLSAGIKLHKKVGNPIETGEPLATICGNDLEKVKESLNMAETAFSFSERQPSPTPLIKKVIGLE